MKNEIWKPVVWYEGLYEVSSAGNIRSIGRIDRLGRYKPATLRKKQLCSSGYHFIQFSDRNAIKKQILVHRVVASAFLESVEGKNEVNHKNGVKTDNRIENLEWVTRSQNNTHAIRTGLRQKLIVCGSRNTNSTITEDVARKIKLLYPDFSYTELAAMYGTTKAVVGSIIKGKTWKHVSTDII